MTMMTTTTSSLSKRTTTTTTSSSSAIIGSGGGRRLGWWWWLWRQRQQQQQRRHNHHHNHHNRRTLQQLPRLLPNNNNGCNCCSRFHLIIVIIILFVWNMILVLQIDNDYYGYYYGCISSSSSSESTTTTTTSLVVKPTHLLLRKNNNDHTTTTTTTTNTTPSISSTSTTTEDRSAAAAGAKSRNNNIGIKNYVVFSVALKSSDDNNNMDIDYYVYLTPLVIRNWSLLGFHPILFVIISTNHKLYNEIYENLWSIILPKETIIIPLIIQPNNVNKIIPITQVIRLYCASILSPSSKLMLPDDLEPLHDDSFLRITDIDMFILNPIPFEPPPIINSNNDGYDNNSTNTNIDIIIYNGKCCLEKKQTNSMIVGPGQQPKICNQYPMHSPGMKVSIWKDLFPLSSTTTSTTSNIQQQHNIIQEIDTIIETSFPGYSNQQINHGDERFWYIDQIMLGCKIDDIIESSNSNKYNYNVHLQEQYGYRMHIGMEIYELYTEIHLSKFNFIEHRNWFNEVVDNTIILMGHRSQYKQYTTEFMKYYNINEIETSEETDDDYV